MWYLTNDSLLHYKSVLYCPLFYLQIEKIDKQTAEIISSPNDELFA